MNVTDQDGVGSPPSKTRLLIDVLWWYPLRALFLAVEAWRQPRRHRAWLRRAVAACMAWRRPQSVCSTHHEPPVPELSITAHQSNSNLFASSSSSGFGSGHVVAQRPETTCIAIGWLSANWLASYNKLKWAIVDSTIEGRGGPQPARCSISQALQNFTLGAG